jgi:NitT/TauT family transport system substrate-binding protein
MTETDRSRSLLERPSRRGALKVLAGGAALASGPSFLLNAARSEPLAKVRLAWAEVAACHAPIAFAVDNRLFRQRNLDVELSFHGLDGSVILDAIASGKVDLGAHLLLDWLKPLQHGQDVKIISGTHGGCQRILASKSAKIEKVEDLRGKTIGVGAIGGVSHVAFIVTLAKAGLDPQADVNWRVFPFDKLGEVVNSGQADALATLDPDAYVFKKQYELVEIANTQTGVYQDRLCCAVAARGDFLRDNRDVTRRVITALIDVHEYTAAHADEVAAFYIAKYKPAISQQDLTEVLGALTYHHHPVGPALVKEAIASIDDLKLVKVLDPQIDPSAFATKITDNILL